VSTDVVAGSPDSGIVHSTDRTPGRWSRTAVRIRPDSTLVGTRRPTLDGNDSQLDIT